MAICSPSQNPAIPKGLRMMKDNEITGEIQRWAKSFADDVSIPIGDFTHRKWWKSRQGTLLPIVAAILCHTYTVHGDQITQGFYHGVTLFVAVDPTWYPVNQPAPPMQLQPGLPFPAPADTQSPDVFPEPVTQAPQKTTDWPYVLASGAAIVAIGAAFMFALRHAGRR